MFTFVGKRILDDKNYAISQFINSGLRKNQSKRMQSQKFTEVICIVMIW